MLLINWAVKWFSAEKITRGASQNALLKKAKNGVLMRGEMLKIDVEK